MDIDGVDLNAVGIGQAPFLSHGLFDLIQSYNMELCVIQYTTALIAFHGNCNGIRLHLPSAVTPDQLDSLCRLVTLEIVRQAELGRVLFCVIRRLDSNAKGVGATCIDHCCIRSIVPQQTVVAIFMFCISVYTVYHNSAVAQCFRNLFGTGDCRLGVEMDDVVTVRKIFCHGNRSVVGVALTLRGAVPTVQTV